MFPKIAECHKGLPRGMYSNCKCYVNCTTTGSDYFTYMELYLVVSYCRHRSDEHVINACYEMYKGIYSFNTKFHVSNRSHSLMVSIKFSFFLSF